MRGFTMIELMVTIAIVGILLGIAAPSFKDAIERQKIKSSLSDLRTAISTARNEAIRTRTAVLLMSDNAFAGSGTVTEWQNGAAIVRDVNGNGRYDAGTDVVVRRIAAVAGIKSVQSGAGGTGIIGYSAAGVPSGQPKWLLSTPDDREQTTMCLFLAGGERVSRGDVNCQ